MSQLDPTKRLKMMNSNVPLNPPPSPPPTPDLNFYCLEKIFVHIPMQELLPYRRVCTKWCGEIEALCRRQKLSLILCCTNDYTFTQIQPIWSFNERFFNCINLERFVMISPAKSADWYRSSSAGVKELTHALTDEACEFLLRLFPAPQELVLYGIEKSDSFGTFVTELLGGWSSCLVSLSLICRNGSPQVTNMDREENPDVNDMIDFINSCAHLKHLDLSYVYSDMAHLLRQLEMPTLARLEHLSIKVDAAASRMIDYFPHYYFSHKALPNCTRLWCDGPLYWKGYIAYGWWWRPSTEVHVQAFLSNLTHLRMDVAKDGALEHFLEYTSSIRVLSLRFWDDSKLQNCQVFSQLARLTNMNELRLYNLPLWTPICLPPKYLINPQVNVHKLVLDGGGYSSYYYIIPAVEAYFPNLKELISTSSYTGENFSRPPQRMQKEEWKGRQWFHYYW